MANNTTTVVKHNTSRARQAARRLGIEIEQPMPHLPIDEQEQTDTM